MLYWLLYQKLFPYFSVFRIFRYLTFRTAFASLTALLIGLLIGPFVIERLREFQIGQYVREDGPQTHLKKGGTPTMGGVLIVHLDPGADAAVGGPVEPGMSGSRCCRRWRLAAIGFADDYIKVVKKRSMGLTAWQKLGLQFAASAAVAVDAAAAGEARQLLDAADGAVCQEVPAGPGLAVDGRIPHMHWLAFLPFVIFVMLVITLTSNAVNLTDGLDGLAIGCTIIAAGALAVLTYVSGHVVFSRLPGTATACRWSAR